MVLPALGTLSLVVPLLAVPAGPAPAVVLDDTRAPSRTTYAVPLGRAAAGTPAEPEPTPAVGTSRTWLGLDDVEGRYYRKSYTLRGVGEHIEVWVADELAFPADDCRKSPVSVTDAQVSGLITEFDKTIWPRETATFSTPPERDGTDPVLTGDFTGDGGRTVTLVDNVRDDNYFDFPKHATYIAGFFSAQLNELVDRNVMTVDAYDWAHRTGVNPPDEPTDDLCTSRPARPRMYEGTFAHEWQHLLQSYADPDEDVWLNEGLSDYAASLTGYVDPRKGVHHRGADSHLTCFQGFGVVKTDYNTNPRECGGPQNSLNLWEEGAPAEVLADYGHAYQFLLYLAGRFGPEVISRLHRDSRRQGLASVADALPVPLTDVIHDFQVMTLADKTLGDGGDVRYTAPTLRSTVNLGNPTAYGWPGAAPNGADYVKLPRGRDLKSVTFTGAKTLPAEPLEWTIADGALFAGNASRTDAAAVVVVTVPAGDPELRISTRYAAEEGYDFGYVIVSTDGGRTYQPVAGDQTVAGPLGPGVTGRTGEFVPHKYDLKAYAGKKVLLGFRYVSDAVVNAGGWYVTGIDVGGKRIGADLAVFRSPTQIKRTPVPGWAARLVGLRDGAIRVVPVARFAELRDFDRVVAVIGQDDPSGRIDQYARYELVVNGKLQPGG